MSSCKRHKEICFFAVWKCAFFSLMLFKNILGLFRKTPVHDYKRSTIYHYVFHLQWNLFVRKMLPMLSPLTKLRLWEVDRKVCGARGGEESSANLQMSFIGFSKLMGIGWDAQLLEKHSRLVVASDFIAANQICKVPSWCLSAAGEKRRCSTWDAVAKQPPAIKTSS